MKRLKQEFEERLVRLKVAKVGRLRGKLGEEVRLVKKLKTKLMAKKNQGLNVKR